MKLKSLLLPLAIITSILMAVVGCKPKAQDVPELKATITIQGAKTVEVGKVIRLQAKIVPANPSEKVTWSSSDPSIATVDNGAVKGLKAGKVSITAALQNGTKASHEVMVTGEGEAPKVEPKAGIKLDVTNKSLKVGEEFALKAILDPTDAKDKITWQSSASEVASVKEGKVTALKPGKATITAKLENGNKADCQVTVTAKEEGGDTPTPPAPGAGSFTFVENPITITMGDKLNLSEKIKYVTKLADGASVNYEEVEVATPDNSWRPLLTITSTGVITTNNSGETKVKVTRSDTKESITVKIIVKDKTFKVPSGSKIVVTGGDGTNDVVSVKVQTEMPFVLKAKVVGPNNEQIKDVEIACKYDSNLLGPDFTDPTKFSTYDDGDTEVIYTVKGTDLKTVVKVNLNYDNDSKVVYSKKSSGIGVVIE